MTDAPYINRAAVKKLAIGYSRTNRAGKFTRVGQSFFDRINAQVVAALAAELERDEIPLYIKRSEVKKLAVRMIEERQLKRKIDAATLKKINARIAEIITAEVQRHPSIGKTLE
jgi:hypothetical protein